MKPETYFPSLPMIAQARITLSGIITPTSLMFNQYWSDRTGARVSFKREDQQIVRSYKIRGAFNKIKSLPEEELSRGVVCASAGNHAQGVALSCRRLGARGYIYMPRTTPRQKIDSVEMFGNGAVEIVLFGDNFDETNIEAQAFSERMGCTFIPPFDDPKIIEGQATIGMEILQETGDPIDYIFVPIGGGGLAAGVGACFKQMSPGTRVIGVEPAGAAGMALSLKNGCVTSLESVDNFVDGAAVKTVGKLTFEICRSVLDDIISVPEGAVCSTILEMYNRNAIVVEPAGALSVAALEQYKDRIAGKNVVCILSGSNNDITRMEEIREKSLLYKGLKHYFIIRFPQRAGALLSFVRDVLGEGNDITYFSYTKKTNRENGPAVIGIELSSPEEFPGLLKRMDDHGVVYDYLNDKKDLFEFLI